MDELSMEFLSSAKKSLLIFILPLFFVLAPVNIDEGVRLQTASADVTSRPLNTPAAVITACNRVANVFGLQIAFDRTVTMARGTPGDPNAVYQCNVVTSVPPVLQYVGEFFDGAGQRVDLNGTQRVTVGTLGTATTSAAAAGTKTCSLTGGTFTFNDCIWKPVMAKLGQLALAGNSYLLLGVGTIFDVLIQYVIVDFMGTLTKLGILGDGGALNIGWTVFRDFANILIIGMFVFIAISLILGLKEYGQKKLIANVLVIAVLLNFSLLFTTLIIDGSNYVAQQFYNGMRTSTTSGIAQAFLKPMGITTIWQDAGKLTEKAAEDNDSGWAAYFFGAVGGLMLFAVSCVLLYGSYLIAARGVLLVVLMLVSAVAFATYLIPSLSGGEYGFKAWLKTLLNAAIFAPLLMLSLAISLAIVTVAGDITKPALGSIAANPASLSTAWQSILVYALGTALLFISFRLSSKFAGHISGFNLGALATMIPLGLASRFIAAPAMRGAFAGRRALNKSEALQKGARNANLDATFHTSAASQYAAQAAAAKQAGNSRAEAQALQNEASARRLAASSVNSAAKLARQAADARERAGRTFNVMDTKGAKAVNQAIGNTGKLSGESGTKATSYLADVEERAKRATKMAEGARPGAEEQEAMRERAKEEATRQHEAEVSRRQAAHQDSIAAQRVAEQQLQVQRDALRTQNAGIIQQQQLAEASLTSAKAAKRTTEEAFVKRTSELAREIRDASTDAEKARLRSELSDLQRAHPINIRDADTAINEEQRKVTAANADYTREVDGALTTQVAAVEAAKGVVRNADQAVKSLVQGMQKDIESKTNAIFKSYGDAANTATADVAARIGKSIGDSKVAELARASMKKKQGKGQRLREAMKENFETDAPTQTTPPTSPTPPAGGPTTTT